VEENIILIPHDIILYRRKYAQYAYCFFITFISSKIYNPVVFIQQPQNEKTESYIEKVIKQKIEPTVINNVKPGWVEVKRDSSNRKKLIYTYGETTITEKKQEKKEKREENKNSIGEPQVLVALANLYKKQTREYINMWGYENWEKLYRFPNHDYDYFERLDEEIEMKELELEEIQNNITYANECY
jgi:hypothetical protein